MHKTDIMSKMNKYTLNKDQRGFVAFFVTIMVMIIFGVLILSFSQISNREGVSALNRNLSTNALYAAESGINDAYTTIRNASDASSPSGGTGTQTYSYTGSTQTYTVPAGVTSINVTLYGGAGGNGSSNGGLGGETTGTLSVTPGEILKLVVGGVGGASALQNTPGGYPDGGESLLGGSFATAGGGGGSSQILNGSTPLAIAGGGGGGGANGGGLGGAGGGTVGGTGVSNPSGAASATG